MMMQRGRIGIVALAGIVALISSARADDPQNQAAKQPATRKG
jgi:hypothetical protein